MKEELLEDSLDKLLSSRIYTFLDEKEDLVWQFLDGRQLILDLALASRLKGKAFQDFRDAVLTFQLLQAFLKSGQGYGFYLDSQNPLFCLKLETNSYGNMRAMVVPSDLSEFPKHHSGIFRLVKTSPSEAQPYTSVIELKHELIKTIVNKVLEISVQVDAHVALSEVVDQSILLHKLPSHAKQHDQTDPEQKHINFARDYFLRRQPDIRKLLDMTWSSETSLIATAATLNLTYLGSSPVTFTCTCSHERMVLNLVRVARLSPEDLQPELSQQGFVEVTCDYCLKSYQISQREIAEHPLDS